MASDRIFFDGKYHNDVFFDGHKHKEAWMNGELVWQKTPIQKYFEEFVDTKFFGFTYIIRNINGKLIILPMSVTDDRSFKIWEIDTNAPILKREPIFDNIQYFIVNIHNYEEMPFMLMSREGDKYSKIDSTFNFDSYLTVTYKGDAYYLTGPRVIHTRGSVHGEKYMYNDGTTLSYENGEKRIVVWRKSSEYIEAIKEYADVDYTRMLRYYRIQGNSATPIYSPYEMCFTSVFVGNQYINVHPDMTSEIYYKASLASRSTLENIVYLHKYHYDLLTNKETLIGGVIAHLTDDGFIDTSTFYDAEFDYPYSTHLMDVKNTYAYFSGHITATTRGTIITDLQGKVINKFKISEACNMHNYNNYYYLVSRNKIYRTTDFKKIEVWDIGNTNGMSLFDGCRIENYIYTFKLEEHKLQVHRLDLTKGRYKEESNVYTDL